MLHMWKKHTTIFPFFFVCRTLPFSLQSSFSLALGPSTATSSHRLRFWTQPTWARTGLSGWKIDLGPDLFDLFSTGLLLPNFKITSQLFYIDPVCNWENPGLKKGWSVKQLEWTEFYLVNRPQWTKLLIPIRNSDPQGLRKQSWRELPTVQIC